MKAKELLKTGETALVIFTDGRNLQINKGGARSASGVWRVDKNLSVDRVIVYLRNKSKNLNEIYIGDFAGLSPSQVENLENRFVVEFDNAELAGETEENWNGFTNAKRGASLPLRYIG